MYHNQFLSLSPSFPSSSLQMFLFSIVQSIVSHLSTRVGQNMMRLLVGTGQVFKPSTRVDYSWNVFNLPHYIPSHFEAEIAVDYKHCDRALSELLNYAVNTTVNSVIEVSKGLMYNQDIGGNLFAVC